MNEVESKTAKLYEDIHPFIEVDSTINDYLRSLNIDKPYFKGKNILDFGVQFHMRQRPGSAQELEIYLIHVVQVNVRVAKSMHEFSRSVSGNLRDHHG